MLNYSDGKGKGLSREEPGRHGHPRPFGLDRVRAEFSGEDDDVLPFELLSTPDAYSPNGAFDAQRSLARRVRILESEVNRHASNYKQVSLCLYDLDEFGGDHLMGVLQTHRTVVVGGVVHENPYYLSPDEFLARRR